MEVEEEAALGSLASGDDFRVFPLRLTCLRLLLRLVVLQLVQKLLQFKRSMVPWVNVCVQEVIAHHNLALVDLR